MYIEDFEDVAELNTNFRKVLHTGDHAQVVVMSIPVGSDIGEEVHDGVDQIIFIVDGDVQAEVDGEVKSAREGSVFFVPAGTKHNFRNVGDEDLKILTVYSPPEHPDGTVHVTKQEAEIYEHE